MKESVTGHHKPPEQIQVSGTVLNTMSSKDICCFDDGGEERRLTPSTQISHRCLTRLRTGDCESMLAYDPTHTPGTL